VKPECSVHLKINHLIHRQGEPVPPAVAKIKRVYESGQFNVMYACATCLSELRRMSSNYQFHIEVEMFNRRSTDELKLEGVL